MKVHIKLVSKNDAPLAREIYRKVIETGHSSFLLCAKDETEKSFLSTMTMREHVLFAIYAGNKVYGIIWLNGFRDNGFGGAHFCLFGKPPELTKVELFRKALSLIINLKDKDGFVFNMLLGLLPESHKPALRFVKECGLSVHYEVPDVPYPSTSPFTGAIEKSVPVTVLREMFKDISPVSLDNKKKKKAQKDLDQKYTRLAMDTRVAIARAREIIRQKEEIGQIEPAEILLSA